MSHSPDRLSTDHASLHETLQLLDARAQLRRRLLQTGLAATATTLLSPSAFAAACQLIPAEDPGPFPGNSQRGPNMLTRSGIVRSDIRSSCCETGHATATGVPVNLTLRLLGTTANCAPLANLAVHVWHCDAQGRYSLYSEDVTKENYLRGVQVSDTNGEVHFTTIFPACYPGRWPHIHFEIYASVEQASAGKGPLRVSQLAIPEDACRAVYAQADQYPESTEYLDRLSLDSDFVLRDDGGVLQMAATTGDIAKGYRMSLDVGLAGKPAA